MYDTLNEKCGIVGLFAPKLSVARFAFFGLFALQHRGQEASGITTSDGKILHTHKGAGLVSQVYTEEAIASLPGYIAIGHNRYSTSGGGALDHAQPVVDPALGFALAHNGNLPSTVALQAFLKEKNSWQADRSDSEYIADAIVALIREGKQVEEAIKELFPKFTGAFSLVMMTSTKLIALRDSFGMRPLSLGTVESGYMIASETCALSTVGAQFVREVAPAEMIVIDDAGMRSEILAPATPKHDVFEYVYFARPDSIISGKLVYDVRKRSGEVLGREFPLDVDIVVPVPDTAVPVALGYSQVTGIPLEMALVKNRYVHRTFIEPTQEARHASVALKLVPLAPVLAGKRIAVIDDSIVRGTTSRRLVETLYKAGAKEVHFLVSSPPVKFPDFYGIDTPKQSDLIAAHKTVEEIREYLGATSLHYLSLDGLVEAIGLPKDQLSMSFFNGEYPIDILERKDEVTYPNI